MKREPGDRVQDDHGEQTVITPSSPDTNPGYNFGPASFGRNDDVVWTCERPGGDLLSGNQKIDTVKAVRDWVKFMTATERPPITDVFILLDDKELEAYNTPGLIQAYKDAGMTVHHTPYNAPKSYKTIMEQLDVVFNRSSDNANADAASVVHRRRPRAVVHCTHGMGRSGRVAAGWLVYKYGLNVDDAVDEALAAARLAGVERMGSPQQLTEWIQESRS